MREGGCATLAPDGYVNKEERTTRDDNFSNGRHKHWVEPDSDQLIVGTVKRQQGLVTTQTKTTLMMGGSCSTNLSLGGPEESQPEHIFDHFSTPLDFYHAVAFPQQERLKTLLSQSHIR